MDQNSTAVGIPPATPAHSAATRPGGFNCNHQAMVMMGYEAHAQRQSAAAARGGKQEGSDDSRLRQSA
ncbi:MAG: hypothetical protein COW24_05515 [Candidatus Kerfeldbacteria bacterium CG15_BIG_FIL_POST_REV_8_21_14_020_45_12]|uniref:Uncharacterized protein n=1 Tax=Candidatus Kerfeldbacteria bacterium CG15_BIG_FIL_POST_REV_8_21_14_020_45_12 TaxID=2014247 RepID=A0A2M7H2E0_9BACT|nr:MAG: hypothetical protein COW24_05515 [Candidatus Kerfeldbacteria bacterium CG15_BIG_FIL_POST_REV_8_21_14_020_45_12]PJA93920.1 MAG: hypothetical protein CO132_01045 [Candidatus Kerfeldbacteria bacterium CG_4_9_14_3_um_filter_45_8]